MGSIVQSEGTEGLTSQPAYWFQKVSVVNKKEQNLSIKICWLMVRKHYREKACDGWGGEGRKEKEGG